MSTQRIRLTSIGLLALASTLLAGVAVAPMPAHATAAPAYVGEAPGPATNLTATAYVDEVKLTWSNPAGAAETVVRGAPGTVPPAGPEDGFAVPASLSIMPTATATGLEPGQPYSFAVFARDLEGAYGAPAVVTVNSLTVTAAVSRDRVTFGQEVTITGRVVDTMTGAPAEYADIRVVAHRPSGEAFLISEDFSRADGQFAIPFAPPEALQFAVVAMGDAAHLAGVGVTRPVLVSSAVYLQSVPKKGKLGTTFVLLGGADPIHTGLPLVLQKKVNNKWKTVLKQKPNKNGITRFKVTPKSKGKHFYRVYKAGAPGVGGGTSRTITLRVT